MTLDKTIREFVHLVSLMPDREARLRAIREFAARSGIPEKRLLRRLGRETAARRGGRR